MNSALLKINVRDIAKGAILAVLVAVLGALQQAVSAHGFDVAAYNWGFILDLAVNSFLAYLAKNLLSDENGQFLGSI